MFVVLPFTAWAPFHRGIRDEEGKLVRMLTFEPGVPQFCGGQDFLAIADDIGPALQLCNQRDDGKALPLAPEEQAKLLAKYRKNPPTKPPALIPDANTKPAKAKQEAPEQEPVTA